MKKDILVKTILAAAIIVLAILSFTGKEKTAYIDVNVLLEKYDGMKDARIAFELKNKEWQAKIDTLISSFENELKAYEKERLKMTKKEKELKQELLSNKQIQISQYREAIQQKAAKEEKTMSQTHFNTINDFLKEYGEEEGYTYIFGATGSGNLLYADKNNELTEEVLEALNKEYAKKN